MSININDINHSRVGNADDLTICSLICSLFRFGMYKNYTYTVTNEVYDNINNYK